MLWASGLKFLLFTQQPSTCVGQSEYSIFNIYNWSMLVACYSTSKVDGPPFIKWSMVWSQWQSISWHVMASRSAIAIVHGMPRQRWSKVLRRHYFAHYFWEITKKITFWKTTLNRKMKLVYHALALRSAPKVEKKFVDNWWGLVYQEISAKINLRSTWPTLPRFSNWVCKDT